MLKQSLLCTSMIAGLACAADDHPIASVPLDAFTTAPAPTPTPIPVSLAGRDIELMPTVAHAVSAVDGHVLRGHIAGESGRFVLANVDGAIAGAVWLDDAVYELRPTQTTGVFRVIETDPETLPSCGVVGDPGQFEPEAARPRFGMRSSRSAGTDQVARVLIAYNLQATADLGSASAIESHALALIASANDAYDNSAMSLGDLGVTSCRLELAGTLTVDSGPTPSSASAMLSRVLASSDGHMDELHLVRDIIAADTVALIVDTPSLPGAGGIANLGFGPVGTSLITPNLGSVTRLATSLTRFIFAHEVGHNQGAEHDPDNVNPGAASYAQGHRWNTVPSGIEHRSIMAYAPGAIKPHFSNPDVNESGAPTGTAINDNARRISETFPSFANIQLGSGSTLADCNSNGEPDTVEIFYDVSLDSDFSGVLDACELSQGLLDDCNGDGIADISQATPRFETRLSNIRILGAPPRQTTLANRPTAFGSVTIDLEANGDLDDSDEYIDLYIDGAFYARLWEFDGFKCDTEQTTAQTTLTQSEWNGLSSDPVFEIVRSPSVVLACLNVASTIVRISVSGNTSNPALDSDNNGIIDTCERCNAADLAPAFGVLDTFDVTAFTDGFAAQDPIADLDNDGIFDLDDVTIFNLAFTAGCP